MRRLALGVALSLAIATPARAYFEQTNAGARVVALGPSAMAIVNDISAYHWNPAALATLQRAELVLDYSKPYGVENLSENAVAAGARALGTGVVFAWHRMSVTDIYAEDQFCAAAGRTVFHGPGGQYVDAGATFKFGRAAFQPFDVPGSGSVDYGVQSKGSMDVGVRWRTPWSVDFAWVARDVLQPRYEFIADTGGEMLVPRQELAAGLHWNRESTITAGWAQRNGHSSTMSAGIEILFFDVFAIRSGLANLGNVYAADKSPNDVQFSGGFGVFHRGYYVDAAAETNHDLGASYRVSLRFPLGHAGAR
jgi:hypothetical protein